MMIHGPRKIYFFIYSKRYVDPCDPQNYAQSWENKQNKTYVGFPGGYDTGEERWRTDQQSSGSIHRIKKCCCSLRKKKVCTHVQHARMYVYTHANTHTLTNII